MKLLYKKKGIVTTDSIHFDLFVQCHHSLWHHVNVQMEMYILIKIICRHQLEIRDKHETDMALVLTVVPSMRW